MLILNTKRYAEIKKMNIEIMFKDFSKDVFSNVMLTSFEWGITPINDGDNLYGPEPFSIFQFGKYDTLTM